METHLLGILVLYETIQTLDCLDLDPVVQPLLARVKNFGTDKLKSSKSNQLLTDNQPLTIGLSIK